MSVRADEAPNVELSSTLEYLLYFKDNLAESKNAIHSHDGKKDVSLDTMSKTGVREIAVPAGLLGGGKLISVRSIVRPPDL